MPKDPMCDRPDVSSAGAICPLDFLRAHAEQLGGSVRGSWRFEVRSVASDRLTTHQLELIAPGAGGARKVLVALTHPADTPYPVDVEADDIHPGAAWPAAVGRHEGSSTDGYSRRAETFADLSQLVGHLLRSSAVQAIVTSMLARINEQKAFAAAG